MPGEIRNHIYQLSLLEPGRVDVTLKRHHLKPGLLRCCRTIREEATSIFYENTFFIRIERLQVVNFAPRWLCSDNRIPREQIRLNFVGRPSWSNLKSWARGFHAGEVFEIPARWRDSSTKWQRIVSKMFSLVRTFEDATWAELNEALELFKAVVEDAAGRKIFKD